MKILAIETSCDETAIAMLECSGNPRNGEVSFTVLSNIVLSQAALHAEYGGVFPSLAKREHSKNLIPVLKQALGEANLENHKTQITPHQNKFGTGQANHKQIPKPKSQIQNIPDTKYQILNTVLEREPELLAQFLEFIPTIQKPPIDAIAVTYGPGLEPALWVGINFAKALALVWDLPIIPINHMEGHLVASLLAQKDAERTRNNAEKNDPSSNIRHTVYDIQKVSFPMLALLVSGGHTELVLSRDWLQYEIVGETRDDAAGEAFDKVARMLGLGYPGGPAIAAEAARWKSQITKSKSQTKQKTQNQKIKLPRPMLDSGDFDFSFSGLKTAVLYQLKKIPELTPDIVQEFAYEFQESVVEVLVAKTIRAAQKHGARAVLLGGGVSANTRLKEALGEKIAEKLDTVSFLAAPREFTGDNAVMIGVAAYLRHRIAPREYPISDISAEGTLRIGKRLA